MRVLEFSVKYVVALSERHTIPEQLSLINLLHPPRLFREFDGVVYEVVDKNVREATEEEMEEMEDLGFDDLCF